VVRIAVVTAARGRHDHLTRQQEGIAAGRVQPDLRVLAAIDDRAVATVIDPAVEVVHLPGSDRLPMAAARNAGAARAFASGADAVVFLDVDVIPGADLLSRYAEALTQAPGALLSGPVAYLPPGEHVLADLPRHPPHPARPAPPPGVLQSCTQPALFWSLSFALTAATWDQIGGFDEAYAGYGAEDTDFGLRAAARGVPLLWVGGAVGYHQHHPVSSPPVEHLEDILLNGRIFRRTWGFWPMSGWLAAFERQGLIRPAGDDWVRVRTAAGGRGPATRSGP
jgi:N-acetylglucosaminyl-diphospho-decaprenol L-rhamnosyltransferase